MKQSTPQSIEVRANAKEPEIWTADDVAQYLKCTSRHVYNLAKRGQIPGHQFGTMWRFQKQQIVSMLQ